MSYHQHVQPAEGLMDWLYQNDDLQTLLDAIDTVDNKTDDEKQELLDIFLRSDVRGWATADQSKAIKLRNFLLAETERLQQEFAKKKNLAIRRKVVRLRLKLREVNEIFAPDFFDNEEAFQAKADEFVASGLFERMKNEFLGFLQYRQGTTISEWLSNFKAAFGSWRRRISRDHIILFFCVMGGLAILWYGSALTGIIGSIVKSLNMINQTMLKIPFLHFAHFIPGLVSADTNEERVDLAKKAAIDSTLVVFLRFFFKYTLTTLTGFDPSNHVMLVMSIVNNIARQAPADLNSPKKRASVVFSFSSMIILGVGLFNTATGVSPRSGKAYHTTLELISGTIVGMFLQTVGQRYQQKIRSSFPARCLQALWDLLKRIPGLIYKAIYGGIGGDAKMGASPQLEEEHVGEMVDALEEPNYSNPQDPQHILSSVEITFGPQALRVRARNGKCLHDIVEKLPVTGIIF